MREFIDSHIHLDHYEEHQIGRILGDLPGIGCEALISVSYDFASCKKNLELGRRCGRVKPAFGHHPEQPLPSDEELADLQAFITANTDGMVAVGEVGLPYYLRQEKGEVDRKRYAEVLSFWIGLAKKLDKPIILHAVYDDADIACDLLEEHSFSRAHFHWFKGAGPTVERMMENGYFVSVTPDVCYEPEIESLARAVPLDRLMAETDGPWPFEGPFAGMPTHPAMIRHSIAAIARLKKEEGDTVGRILFENTKKFFRLDG